MGHVVKARDQVEQGGLAAPGRAHQGHGLAPLHLEIDALKGRRPISIGKAHILKGQGAQAPTDGLGCWPVGDLRLHVQGRKQPTCGRQTLGEHRLQVGQLAQRL